MTDYTEEGISDELLDKAKQDIQELLNKRGLAKGERVQLEVQSYFLMFLISDHKKIMQMYPFFRSEKERRDKNKLWWDKLQWVIIPMGLTVVLGFIAEFVYFWMTIVPSITK